ncbi:hypothetical protein [Thalassospira xiamenensis]|uniref:O-antigen ligase n=1 Tax=Thalassospira xiamenensis TaxID=220697 RepID=A0A285TX27_9PROT|nr:hypothetical protein [Thalassospira xiamenensis]SOC30110.1 O-antigen ligase [Thalassospira xiamenensis]
MSKIPVASSVVRLKNAELIVAALILAVGALSTMAALPVFRFGVWRDSEPTVIAVLVTGAMAWGWGGYCYYSNGEAKVPLTIAVSLLFSLWCCFTSMFAPFPILSFLGSPQLGEGPILFLCWSGFMLLVWAVWQERGTICLAFAAGIFMVFYAASAHQLDENSAFRLFGFSDYVGVFAVLLPALLYCMARQFILPPYLRHVLVLIGYGASVLMSLAAGNKGAALALVFSTAIWALCSLLFSKGKVVWQRLAIWGAMIAIVLVPICIMVGLWALGQGADIYQEDSEPSLLFNLYSVVSRGLMLKLTSYAFEEAGIGAYLVGNGFGHSLFYVQNYLPLSGQSFLYPHWDVFYRDFVHTHSIPYEILLSGGVLALVLYFLVFCLWIYEAALEDRPIVIATALGYLTVTSIWFEFASLIPLLALIMGSTLQHGERLDGHSGGFVWSRYRLQASVFIGFVLLAGAGWLYQQNRGLDRSLFMEKSLSATEQGVPSDGARGHISLQRALLDGCNKLTDQNSLQDRSPRSFQWCEKLLQHAYNEIGARPSSSLVLAYLVVTANFVNTSIEALPAYEDIRQLLIRRWGDVASQLIAVAPHRIDILIPYFSYLADTNVSASVQRQGDLILDAFIRYEPENPIVLWFDGQRDLMAHSPEQVINGLNKMISAIERHSLERYVALTEDMLAKLYKTRAEFEARR